MLTELFLLGVIVKLLMEWLQAAESKKKLYKFRAPKLHGKSSKQHSACESQCRIVTREACEGQFACASLEKQVHSPIGYKFKMTEARPISQCILPDTHPA